MDDMTGHDVVMSLARAAEGAALAIKRQAFGGHDHNGSTLDAIEFAQANLDYATKLIKEGE